MIRGLRMVGLKHGSRAFPVALHFFSTEQGSSQAATSIGDGKDQSRGWTWNSDTPRKPSYSQDIEVKLKVPLTIEEVVKALEKNGGKDINVIDVSDKTILTETMVFCTGKNMRHMQRLCDVITYALKKRNLRYAPGIRGATGYYDDDWMLVDCWNMIVHVFDENYRKELKLEERWENTPPFDQQDVHEKLDDDSDDGEVEEDASESSDILEIKDVKERERIEAQRIAALWKAHIDGARTFGKKN